jgi:hypothetical protein
MIPVLKISNAQPEVSWMRCCLAVPNESGAPCQVDLRTERGFDHAPEEQSCDQQTLIE